MATHSIRSAALLAGLCLAAIGFQAPTSAQEVTLALNLIFNDPLDENSGGKWEVVALSDVESTFGLSVIGFGLDGVSGDVQPGLPAGQLQGSLTPNAGFAVQAIDFDPSAGSLAGELQFAASQTISGAAGTFFGVGTLTNGSPAFPGQIEGTNSEGPELPTLASATGVPFGFDIFGQEEFATAAQVAFGTFAAGETPEFEDITGGSFEATVFTSLASVDNEADAAITTIVRTNLFIEGDINGDGSIDLADFTILRDTLGDEVEPGTGADLSNNGLIDIADFAILQENFGQEILVPVLPLPGAPAAPVTAVPEPHSLLMLGLAAAFCSMFSAKRGAVAAQRVNS